MCTGDFRAISAVHSASEVVSAFCQRPVSQLFIGKSGKTCTDFTVRTEHVAFKMAVGLERIPTELLVNIVLCLRHLAERNALCLQARPEVRRAGSSVCPALIARDSLSAV
ncbi:hypothetical protein DOTSEDRAFT_42288 [Dothistroma septosporum NZE10]|uniref:Uncharacterized protein n=1 Tax=Dothistroma septosporum (strain NZE10 / CBS 128990) TaxID=675120 RepID=N1Q018_DOTSN|nr:hypothetical protein DOTSEDRAFT_42288 [Dothistroma septosporum NZE10]